MAEDVATGLAEVTRLLNERASLLARRERGTDASTLLPHVAFAPLESSLRCRCNMSCMPADCAT